MTVSTSVATDDSIAVVIINYNGASYIEACLTALSSQTVAADRILVVDNASTDQSGDLVEVKFPQVELIRLEENTGFAGGNNIAFKAVEDCTWVALLNPDTEASPTWIEQLKTAINDSPGINIFSCRLEDLHTPGLLDGTGDQYHVSGLGWRRDHGYSVDIKRNKEEVVFAPCAAAALYRLSAVRAAGAFDEDYFCYNEDTDLVFRMRLGGERCIHLDHCVVRHAGSGISGLSSAFSIYHGHRNLVWTFFKNMPTPLLWLYLPQHLLLNLVSIAYFSFKGQSRVILKAKWHAVRGLPRIFRLRKQIQKNRRVSCNAISSAMIRNPLAAYFNRYAR